MRLIDADVLISEFRKEMDKSIFEGRSVKEVIDDMPTVDAVPVVRCKDCKWWSDWGNGTGSCELSEDAMRREDATDFCSFGERKDDDKSCDTCKHHDKGWDDIVCDGCTKAHSNWERRDDEIDRR